MKIKSLKSQPLGQVPPQKPFANRLQAFVALVTGAGGNVGLEKSARRSLLEDAKVVLVDVNSDKLSESQGSLLDTVKESSPE